MTRMLIRDVSLFVQVLGQGPPLLLMHGGPGLDHTTMQPFRAAAEHFTLVFYDHRCNGRSTGADVSSMTFTNLTADADALRPGGYPKSCAGWPCYSSSSPARRAFSAAA